MQVPGNPRSLLLDTSCGALLRELQQIWDEIGEDEADKDRMLLELEKECLDVYRRKVDKVSNDKARLHQTVAAKEAELAGLMAIMGELNAHSQAERTLLSLKEQLASVDPLLERLRVKKEERIKQFTDIKAQIEKINGEISGSCYWKESAVNEIIIDENDLSLRKLHEYEAHLLSLQKEKSERLHKVLERVNEVHVLCGVLCMDFGKIVSDVHPSLHDTFPGSCTNISSDTLDGLAQTILKLKLEKKDRLLKLKDIGASLFQLWGLMDTPEEEKKQFDWVTFILGSSEQESTNVCVLSQEMIDKAASEVERLMKMKEGRMKELILKKRSELEVTCREAHVEPDMSTAPEKSNALIDSGIVDPSELLASIEAQIIKVKEESLERRDILDKIDKWLALCEEERWLEEYNQDENRYSAGRGAHISLKRAERARVTVNKIPGIVDNLIKKTCAWEKERNTPFLYDGVRLVSILEKYKLTRQEKEEAKKRFRDQKKLQDMLLTEREAMYGSKPSPKRSNSLRKPNGVRANGNGAMTPIPRRLSVGSATPELLTPRSYSGRQNGHFKQMRRLSTVPFNFVALPKEDTTSFASVGGSESGSSPQA